MAAASEFAGARVVLYQLPNLMRAVVLNLLASDPTLDVAAEIETEARLEPTMHETGATIVVCVADDGQLPAACRAILQTPARIVIVGLSGAGQGASVHRLAPHRVSLNDVSADALLLILHAQAGSGSG
jgi:hypothetical protein